MARVWNRIGRVPLRTKIFGIVLAATCSTGLGVIVWANLSLGVIVQPNTPAFALSELLAVMAIAAIVGLAVAWLLTNVLTHQVQQVTRVAQQVTRGNLSERVRVWASDDIGELAVAFNAMMDSLARSNEALEQSNQQLSTRNRELTTLYDLALLATHSASMEAILDRALEKVTETSGAAAGAILLLDESGALAVVASCNLPAAARKAYETFHPDDPLFQQIVRTTEPVLRSAEALDAAEVSVLSAFGDVAGMRPSCAIPLQSHEGVRGVIVLFQPQGRVLSPAYTDLSFLQAVGHEVSAAVENIRLWDEITRKDALRARLLTKAVTAQELERERISRELHDEAGQSLTALLVQLRLFEHLPSREAMLTHADELRVLVLETLEEVRRLARDLRPATLDELGLIPTIEWHIRTFSRNSHLQVLFVNSVPETFRLPVHTEIALYRVVQEALTNVIRHARATQATVELEERNGVLHLAVCDNGCGFDVNSVMKSEERGLGLLGIQERVELIGGTLNLESAAGSGTRLWVHVPALERALS
jgi:signal transduction histidine kinase